MKTKKANYQDATEDMRLLVLNDQGLNGQFMEEFEAMSSRGSSRDEIVKAISASLENIFEEERKQAALGPILDGVIGGYLADVDWQTVVESALSDELEEMEKEAPVQASRRKTAGNFAFDVFLNDEEIDTVFQSSNDDPEDVKKSLINHDGYDPGIQVLNRQTGQRTAAIGVPWVAKEASRRTAGDWSPLSTFPAGVEVEILENPAYPGAVGTSQVGKRGTVVKSEPNEVEGGEQIVTVDVDGNELKFYESSLKKSASRTAAVASPEADASIDRTIGDGQLYGDDAALKDQLSERLKGTDSAKKAAMRAIRIAENLDRQGKFTEAKKADDFAKIKYNEFKRREASAKRLAEALSKRIASRRQAALEPKPFFANKEKADADNPFVDGRNL